MSEFYEKQRRIQAVLESHKLDALLLRRVSSFAWATCGVTSSINTATSTGSSQLLITKSKRFLITDNMEATRFIWEEKVGDQIARIIGGAPGSVQVQTNASIALSTVASCFDFGSARRNKVITHE